MISITARFPHAVPLQRPEDSGEVPPIDGITAPPGRSWGVGATGAGGDGACTAGGSSGGLGGGDL